MSLGITPIALLLGVASGGAGHGNYGLAKTLFPFAMLSVLITDGVISIFGIVLAVAQFPIYGVIAGLSIVQSRWLPVVAMLAVHVVSAIVCFPLMAERGFG